MSKKSEVIAEDLYVTRQVILEFFDPPPGRSTFFEWVNAGKIVSAGSGKVLKGYYALNASLQRLGLPLIDVSRYRERMKKVPAVARERQLLFAAMAALSEEVLLCPADELPRELTPGDVEKIKGYVEMHRPALDPDLGSAHFLSDGLRRLAYAGGVLDQFDDANYGRIRGSN